MSRTIINFLLDALLLTTFSVLVATSVIVRFVFPPGTDARGWLLWRLSYDQWAMVQFAILCFLTFCILIHVMLHWSWVCGVIATRLTRDKKAKLDEGTQTIYGVGFLILILNLLGLAIAVAALTIKAPG